MSKNKTYTAKSKALYSIQFWRDKSNALNLTETANDGDIVDDGSMYLFGLHLAESKLLSKREKASLARFMGGFLEKMGFVNQEAIRQIYKNTVSVK